MKSKKTLLTLSKRLWEKGLRLETEKWWFILRKQIINPTEEEIKKLGVFKIVGLEGMWFYYDCFYPELHSNLPTEKEIEEMSGQIYPAYSTDELLAVMPRNISIKQYDEKDSVRFQVEFDEGYMKQKTYRYDNSLPEALGLMCEWLMDNGYKLKNGGLKR